MAHEFQIGQLVILKRSGINKPGRIIDIYGHRITIGWKVKSHGLNLLSTRKVKPEQLELYIEPKRKNFVIRGILKLFKLTKKTT